MIKLGILIKLGIKITFYESKSAPKGRAARAMEADARKQTQSGCFSGWSGQRDDAQSAAARPKTSVFSSQQV